MKGSEFDAWNVEKKRLDARKVEPLFKEGEVWWCALGVGVGVEIKGNGAHFTRPVVILRKLSGAGCIVAPVTRQERRGDWFHPLDWGQGPRWVMFSQIRLVSAQRLSNRVATLGSKELNALRHALKQFWHF